MRHIFAGFILLFSLCVITSCAPPVGSIINDRSKYDFLMLRPNRILYEVDGGIDGRFDRAEDLKVFVAEKGNYRSLDPSDPKLKLEIIMNPGLMAESITEIITHFPFSEPGRHIIRGTYGDKTDEYSIEVRGSLVNPGEGSNFIAVEWL